MKYQVVYDDNIDDNYELLLGPNGFRCMLTEPEDRSFGRDIEPLVSELNRLAEEKTELYPPTLEALKAEPWRWLIADPRDPRAQALVGKKVYCSDTLETHFGISPFELDAVYENVKYGFRRGCESFIFIWPAPIDMQIGETK